ncbi:helix-turn-helix domain-containing protein [Halalkalibacter urbisdiaboli]|uniref:helix-turn-helix domain-containing protein n=1 Tax=Halalkalibacter urbisdiaboli TaxID=1960589 RepID=UPI000B43866A|nr:helix-turn-helix domain-containing protein [Halalkalibacter urbisdiaboli]
MTKKKADVLLHPVRMRIVQALLSHERLTVQQLVEKLADVPQATMYRHLTILREAKAVEVVETHKVRGTTEKVYAVSKEQLKIPDKEVEETAPDEHLKYFMMYQANLLKEFEKYVLNHSPLQYKKDGLGYWQTTLHLSDAEFKEFLDELRALFEKVSENKPTGDRKERIMATTFIPGG